MKKQIELWNDIVGYEGIYQISTLGRIKVLDREVVVTTKNGSHMRKTKEKLHKPNTNNCNYLWVKLTDKKGNCDRHFIHQLIAKHFVSNPLDKKYVNHKDGNKRNNNVTNIEWVTQSENVRHSMEIGTHQFKPKEPFAMIDLRTNSIIGIFRFLTDVHNQYGVSIGNISSILKGKTKTASKKRYTFQYIN